MNMIFKRLEKENLPHEQVVFCKDKKTGLEAIIAIHNTSLGPTLGGCRMHPYASEEEALEDVLHLSEAMSYKSAFADLNLGGGKSVIIGDPSKDKTPELLRSFGKFVDSLGGKYTAAKDLGITEKDLECMGGVTPFVIGAPKESSGSGDPSSATAKGVFYALKWGVKEKLQRDSLKGVRVVIQGVGSVGKELMRFLLEESAELFIYDTQESVLANIKKQYPSVHLITKKEVFNTSCDVFAPCAMGAILNKETIETLDCSVIAGAANNQLESSQIGDAFFKKNILYLPDFVINSGGITYVYSFLEPKKSESWVADKLKSLPDALTNIYLISQKEGISMERAALKFAVKKIQDASCSNEDNSYKK